MGWSKKLLEKHIHINFTSLIKQANKRKKKRQIVNREFQKFGKCSTKKMLQKCLNSMSQANKEILIVYMKYCFIFDVFTRKVINRKMLFTKRNILLECIINPKKLNLECSFDNNLIKNYCTGVINFISRYYSELKLLREEFLRLAQ